MTCLLTFSFNPCSGGSIALGKDIPVLTFLSIFRFNPCSGGSIALEEIAGIFVDPNLDEFQSLFWWKYCPGIWQGLNVADVEKMFQSLFWWKYCPGFGLLWLNCSWKKSILFQSLFWWKYCPGRTMSEIPSVSLLRSFNPCSGGSIALGKLKDSSDPGTLDPSCFNPCSGGSIALGLASAPMPARGRRSKFQSLFWWKYCPGPMRTTSAQ